MARLANLLSEATENDLQLACNEELYASRLYQHISNQLTYLGYFGAASHFKNESDDEISHYRKHVDYLNDRGSVADVPKSPYFSTGEPAVESLKDALTLAYEAELSLGKKYEEWYKNALDEDVTTAQYLLQFLEIQRESVGEYSDLLARLDLCEGNPAALLMIDKELGE